MTDHLKGCWVAFEGDPREDDAEPIMQAIRQIRGVAGVKAKVSDPAHYLAVAAAKRNLVNAIWAIFYPEDQEKP